MLKSLIYFQSLSLPAAVGQLFKDLDVPLNLTGDGAAALPDLLEKNNHPGFGEFVDDVYWIGQMDDNAFEGIQSGARELQQIRGKNYDTILVFALEINRASGLLPTRTQLFDLARAFNREFPYQPVVLVFRYVSHCISIAVVERNDYKVKHLEGDKIGKMSLLRDVDTRENRTHAGHLRILHDMQIPRSGKNAVTTFETLYKHWQQALNVSVLNKKFYKELSNWYFWAIHEVRFPGEPTDGADEELLKTHRANNVIRLITRLIFTWFLKEKKLVPSAVFDLGELTSDYLKVASLTPDQSESSEYYLAILQNLFFATLNQEMNERRFKIDTKVYPHPDHSIKNIYRHAPLFKNADRAVAELFKNIPFLNGGLFECLDIEKNTIDGFSETKTKQPSVPNFLFFQKEERLAEELNVDYGTKGKKYEVRGLIHILNDYKFTIAENTPLEEEVALDPELLGRIFENLLASYNPETKNTARKQTGSFYTPREIVNYMVDESLIAYLKNKLTENHAGHLELGKTQVSLFGEQPNKKGQISLETQPNASRWAGREEQLEQNLRILFSATEAQPFEEAPDVEDLIVALDQCKILDPACGSGAFPMGILHRMVALLHKLDPQNNRWRERQIRNAERIEDSTARTEAIEAIERAFQHNELDYGRKLFLIENCIYGVDIQPIAVQIAKLRFFISLICDQNVDEVADNRGILSLPNLETKFVAANTLIGLENATLAKEAVVDLLDERETLHHRMFSAKKYADKKRFREKDEKLRIQIKEKLESTGWVSNDVSSQLSNWNPFDQNDYARFFDPQWMFGIEEGFDVVIGNPPYLRIQSLSKPDKEYFQRNFISATGNYDMYLLFDEIAFRFLNKNGSLIFIQPNKFINADYGIGIRKLISKNNFLHSIVDFGAEQMFNTATTYTCILHCMKLGGNTFQYVKFRGDLPIEAFQNFIFGRSDPNIITSKIKNANLLGETWAFGEESDMQLYEVLEKKGEALKDIASLIFVGLQTSADPVYILEKRGEKYYSKYLEKEVELEEKFLKPLLKGAEIRRYKIDFQNLWLIFPYKTTPDSINLISPNEFAKESPKTWNYLNQCKIRLSEREPGKLKFNNWYAYIYPKNLGAFEQPKIMTQVLARQATMVLDENNGYYFVGGGNAGGYGITVNRRYNIDLHYLLGLLNSKVIDFYIQGHSTNFQNGYFSYAKRFIENVPIAISNSKNQDSIKLVVKILLFEKAKFQERLYTQTFEQVLNGMVCELYFPDLMKEKEVDILAQVERDLVPYADFAQQSEAEKAANIKALHLLWTHPDSVVRNRLALMPVRSPEVLGVILEGK